MSVTLKQIAERANVSVTTVSRVINGRATGVPIRNETRERILAIASELGYRPNLMARALRGSKSSLIGTIVRDISEPFLNLVLTGVHSAAVKRQYRVFLGHVERQASTTLDYGSMFEQAHADGIIVIGDIQGDEAAVHQLVTKHQYIVGITDRTERRLFPGVYVDNHLGTRVVMDHLWELGHRRITIVSDATILDGVERMLGYRQYMAEHGAETQADIRLTSRSLEGGYEVGMALFSEPDLPTAIFAATDLIAIGLLHAAFQHNVAVPDQVSLVGYDDIDIAKFAVPSLTTVSQSGFEMGAIAANLLLDMIEQDIDMGIVEDQILKPELIIRQSTAQPPAQVQDHSP